MMVPYKFSGLSAERKCEITKRFYELNTGNRNKSCLHMVEDWCRIHLSDIDGKSYSFIDVVCANVDELETIKEYYDTHLKKHSKDNALKYIANNLYDSMTNEAKQYLFDC